MLTPSEEARLIQAWQADRNVGARDAVVRAYARLCYRIASQYSSNPAHIDDLAQEGSLGIKRALDKFDPSHGVKFSTYSRFWVQNFVAAAASRTINVISVPSRTFIDARMGRIPEGKNDAAVAASQPSVALDAPAYDRDGESVLDRLACPRPTPEEAVAASSVQDSMAGAISRAMRNLTDRERTVLVARRLADPPRTLEEIAGDFGVTRERIRQIEVLAMQKLASALKADRFDPSAHFRN